MVVPEPGRRIVAEELAGDGAALPWTNPAAFARRALAMARADLASAAGTAPAGTGPIFFDRGLIDAAVALHHLEGMSLLSSLGGASPYDDPVFLAPPWPEIFATDDARQHAFAEALAEYTRLDAALVALGHQVRLLPKSPVAARCDFVLAALS
jgi:predicted ATPase